MFFYLYDMQGLMFKTNPLDKFKVITNVALIETTLQGISFSLGQL